MIKIIQGADAISNATVKARTLKNPDKWITLGTLAQTVNEFVLEKDTVLLDVKLEWKNVTPSITELVFAKTDTVNVDKAELKKLLDNKEDTSLGQQTVSRHMMRQLQQVRKYMTANMQAKEALTAQYLQLKMQWQTKS